jgi:hydroxyethylthiazole kinase
VTNERWTWGDQPVSEGLRAVSERQPLVHCLTNIVVAGFTANVLLAVGASPAMVENAEESAAFAAIAGGVLVNLGTLSAERERAMSAAAASAADAGVPWVLDPVAVGALAHRTTFAVGLLAHTPTIVRGNPSEILSLAAAAGAVDPAGSRGGRGVDSLAGSTEALDAAGALAKAHGCAVAVSGATDFVTDGSEFLEIPGGDPLMTRVTGVGCALGALMAAMAATNDGDGLAAAGGACAVFAAAGERAAAETDRPGSFAVALIDHLAGLVAG